MAASSKEEVAAGDTPSVTAAAPAARAEYTGQMGGLIGEMMGGAKLGETQAGEAWCLKALHPAESTIQSAPCPVRETRSFASIALNQMDVHTMPASFNPALPWNLTLYMHREPVLLYSWLATQAGAAPVQGFILNRQMTTDANPLTPEPIDLATNSLRSNAEKYRITGQSLTGYFDAASLSDQGHVVVIQTELPRYTLPAVPLSGPTYDIAAHIPWTFYQDYPPTQEVALSSGKAYQGPAKLGFYAPSKLQNVGKWVTTNQVYGMLGTSASAGAPFTVLGTSSFYESDKLIHFYDSFPFCTNHGKPIVRVFEQIDTSLTSVFFTGLGATSSMRITARWTMDLLVRPATIYSPFVRMPPQEDDRALLSYQEVSRRMADSYPSSYNFLGALLPVIGNIAKAVLPTALPLMKSIFTRKVAAARAANKPSWLEAFTAPTLTGEEEAEGAQLMQKAAANQITAGELARLQQLQAAKTAAGGLTGAASGGMDALALALTKLGQGKSGGRSYTRRSRPYKKKRTYRKSGGGSSKRRKSSMED